MKILIVTHYWKPHGGGIEAVSHEQAKRLIEKGHKVSIVSSRIGDESENEIVDRINIIRVKAFNSLERLGVPYPFFSTKLFKVLKTEIKKSDIVHAHGHPYTSSLFAGIFAKRYKKPFILTQHNTFIKYPFPWNIFERLNDIFIGRKTLRLADRIIVVSRETQKYVESLTKKESKILYNGVDTEFYKPCSDKIGLRRKLGIPERIFVVFTARRLSFKNGMDTFMDIVNRLKDKNITFIIAGSGPDEKKIKNLIQKNQLTGCKMLGWLSPDEMIKYYQASDVYVLSSVSGEGFPITILEAFSCGIPVIATRTGGQIEIVKNGINGFLVDSNSPSQIVEKIEFLEKNENIKEEMAITSRNIVQENFSWNKNIKELIKIYEDTLEKNEIVRKKI